MQNPKLEEIKQLAITAGKLTLKWFRKNINVKTKPEEQGLVTEADLASEQFLINYIKNNYNNHNIIAEESGLHNLNNANDNIPTWIIDPLDGTTNFSKGNPYYCVSIAFGYVKNKIFNSEIGVIYQPYYDTCFYAHKNKGSFFSINGNTEQMFVTKETSLKQSLLVTGFSYNKGLKLKLVTDNIFSLQEQCLAVRINGAAALDFANVALGVFDVFFERGLKTWDIAAGALIVKEANGVCFNYEGIELNLLQDINIICGNYLICQEVKKIIINN